MDVPSEPVAEFVAALRQAQSRLAAVREGLSAVDVPDDAFGRLFEAHEVREACRSRGPMIDVDLAEAERVLGHFVAGLSGGHPIMAAP
jgi:hypothetical protein